MVLYAAMHIICSQWTAVGLSREMYPVAQLESSSGKFTEHEKSTRGPLWTATGPLGIKPITAFESLKRNGFSGTEDEVVALLQNDMRFYNRACATHWNFLRNSFPDLKRAVYAWRWGFAAAQAATEWQVAFDMYVLKYFEILSTKK